MSDCQAKGFTHRECIIINKGMEYRHMAIEQTIKLKTCRDALIAKAPPPSTNLDGWHLAFGIVGGLLVGAIGMVVIK